MKQFRKFALAAALTLPLAANAGAYYKVAGKANDLGTGSGVFVDADSEVRIGQYVRMDVFERDRYGESITISVRKTVEFDCSGRRSRMIRSVQFGNDGKVIGSSIDFKGFSNDIPYGKKTAIEQVAGDHAFEQPIEGFILDFVCGTSDFRKQHPLVGNLP